MYRATHAKDWVRLPRFCCTQCKRELHQHCENAVLDRRERKLCRECRSRPWFSFDLLICRSDAIITDELQASLRSHFNASYFSNSTIWRNNIYQISSEEQQERFLSDAYFIAKEVEVRKMVRQFRMMCSPTSLTDAATQNSIAELRHKQGLGEDPFMSSYPKEVEYISTVYGIYLNTDNVQHLIGLGFCQEHFHEIGPTSGRCLIEILPLVTDIYGRSYLTRHMTEEFRALFNLIIMESFYNIAEHQRQYFQKVHLRSHDVGDEYCQQILKSIVEKFRRNNFPVRRLDEDLVSFRFKFSDPNNNSQFRRIQPPRFLQFRVSTNIKELEMSLEPSMNAESRSTARCLPCGARLQ